MDGHITAWRIHRVLAAIYLVAFAALFGYLYFHPAADLPARHVATATWALPALVLFHGLCAHGARVRWPWVRAASLVIGVLLLLAFPIGTIIGAYLLYACARPWGDPRAHAGSARGGWHDEGRRR